MDIHKLNLINFQIFPIFYFFAGILLKLNTMYEIEARSWGYSFQGNKCSEMWLHLSHELYGALRVMNERRKEQYPILDSKLLISFLHVSLATVFPLDKKMQILKTLFRGLGGALHTHL